MATLAVRVPISSSLKAASSSGKDHGCLAGNARAASLKPLTANLSLRRVSDVSTTTSKVNRRMRKLSVVSAATKVKTPAEEEWRVKREKILKNQVRSVSAKDAVRLVEENGYTIVDVRPAPDYETAHPTGAVNIQIYRLIKEWTVWDITRRAAFAFFGVFNGTEENPDFVADFEAKFPKDAKIIVACAQGGTTKPSQNFPEGKQSRSLIAAYVLLVNKYTNVAHLDGGIASYFRERLPVTFKDDSNSN